MDLWCHALKVASFPNQSLGDVGASNGLSGGFISANCDKVSLSEVHSNFSSFTVGYGDHLDHSSDNILKVF